MQANITMSQWAVGAPMVTASILQLVGYASVSAVCFAWWRKSRQWSLLALSVAFLLSALNAVPDLLVQSRLLPSSSPPSSAENQLLFYMLALRLALGFLSPLLLAVAGLHLLTSLREYELIWRRVGLPPVPTKVRPESGN